MVKGDDAVRRKRNKADRKRMRKDSNVSARVASIIAAKRRRQSGKRRTCEGMCFSLPTPEDPFNDRHEKKPTDAKKPLKHSQVPSTGKDSKLKVNVSHQDLEKVVKRSLRKLKDAGQENDKWTSLTHLSKNNPMVLQDPSIGRSEQGPLRNTDSLSKFLVLCLNAIQNAWIKEGTFDGDKDRYLLANTWGIDLWTYCSNGSDILETSGSNLCREQMAWVVSTAADIVSRKEKEGQYVATPFLLILVSSQEEAIKVRSLCKPLKSLGIHTVCLHPGASVDHQVQGLRSCEPEFLVSTPERLMELVSLRAIDISNVSLLALNGLETLSSGGLVDILKVIRCQIHGDPQILIFSDFYGNVSTSMVQHLLVRPFCRLSLDDSVVSLSACITQSVYVYTFEDDQFLKAIEILKEASGNQSRPHHVRVLLVVKTSDKAEQLITFLEAEGFNICHESNLGGSKGAPSTQSHEHSGSRVAVSVIDEQKLFSRTDIKDLEVVVFLDFPPFDEYVRILTTMARQSADGMLHSFFCKANASSAAPLIKLLEECAQPVPDNLRNYLNSSSMSKP
ncbi:DEAD-box ATP-dependent RNA helicase 20 [Aristolochia californica]|uniref:DEAD-box ATP-dependent RNA helicase 20 n=1 Tax=Aristolochia californica TaxID=171875 RepID=UPI0035D78FA9